MGQNLNPAKTLGAGRDANMVSWVEKIQTLFFWEGKPF